jgi:hypothetical protein
MTRRDISRQIRGLSFFQLNADCSALEVASRALQVQI